MKIQVSRVPLRLWSQIREHPVKSVLSLAGALASLWAIFGDAGQVMRLLYAPDVIIGAVPADQLTDFGRRSRLYEFVFDRQKMAVLLRGDADVEKLATVQAVPIPRFACAGKASPTEFYKLSIVVQNVGFQTANQYELIISFSTSNVGGPDQRVDPGVRIIDVNTDALDVSYLYQQEADAKLPDCVRKKVPTDSKETKTVRPSALVRQTYKEFGLTRDVLILSGTLESHLFQIVDVILKVPSGTDRFLVLYHINCITCRFFYRAISYGQALRPKDAGVTNETRVDELSTTPEEARLWF